MSLIYQYTDLVRGLELEGEIEQLKTWKKRVEGDLGAETYFQCRIDKIEEERRKIHKPLVNCVVCGRPFLRMKSNRYTDRTECACEMSRANSRKHKRERPRPKDEQIFENRRKMDALFKKQGR